MRNIERSSLPVMPQTLDALIADMRARFAKDDAIQFLEYIVLSLEYAISAYIDILIEWKQINLERSAGALADAILLCQPYYGETGSAILSNICTALGVRCEVRHAREEHFQPIVSAEEVAQDPSLLGKRPVDNILHRLKSELAAMRQKPDTHRNSFSILKNDLKRAFGNFIDRSIL